MPIFHKGQCRVTKSELAKIRKAAAENGQTVQEIKTSEDMYLAVGKMADPETLAEIVKIQGEVLKEFGIPFPE